tara:strand:- start:25948 stop:26790 length:843 start_codon:yes stop_codon:yes gene_type:complete
MIYKSFNEVSDKCSEGRFFPYDSFHDKLFTPMALFITWICVCLQISANSISWISGFVTILGAILIASDNYFYIFIGSFSYALWYLLDYVDGAIARYNGAGSVEGQYIDWLMHVVSSVAITSGIAIGAIQSSNALIIPFAVLAIIASVLSYAKYSMAWWAIAMEQQQRRAHGKEIRHNEKISKQSTKEGLSFKLVRGFAIAIFHENYLIFSLPFLAFIQFAFLKDLIDLRILFIVLAGTIHFPIVIIEIQKLINRKKLSLAYDDFFNKEKQPDLPNDHFFK